MESIGVHALEGVVPGLAGVVDGHIIAPVCLVNVYVSLRNNCYSFGTWMGKIRFTFSPR
jgi:hypothetical protein